MKIIATTRQAQGTGASRRLRRADKLPGIVYGGKMVRISSLFCALSKCIRTSRKSCTLTSNVSMLMNR